MFCGLRICLAYSCILILLASFVGTCMYVNFHDLNPIEVVRNINRRGDASHCRTILAQYGILSGRKKII